MDLVIHLKSIFLIDLAVREHQEKRIIKKGKRRTRDGNHEEDLGMETDLRGEIFLGKNLPFQSRTGGPAAARVASGTGDRLRRRREQQRRKDHVDEEEEELRQRPSHRRRHLRRGFWRPRWVRSIFLARLGRNSI